MILYLPGLALQALTHDCMEQWWRTFRQRLSEYLTEVMHDPDQDALFECCCDHIYTICRY